VPLLHFIDRGRGAPAVVFVHGFTCDLADWDHPMRTLSATHRCIAAGVDGSLLEGEPDALVARYADMIDSMGMDAFVDRFYEDFFVPSTPAAVRACVGARRARIDLDHARRLLLDFVRWDATRCRAVLASIDVPVLVIQSTAVGPDFERVAIGPGQVSPFARAVIDTVPGAVLETVPCGHFAMLEAPDVTERLLAGWLRRLG